MKQIVYTPGFVIANLRLERLLGTGGFGEVWLAEHLDLGDKVAVKIPLVAEYVRVLRLEGRLQHQLDHENIVHVIDLNTSNEPPYCVMEYVEGENLRQRMGREKKLGVAAARSILRDVLLGLREAHRLGIVHRDLKPENILLNQKGKALIADFGLGSVVHEVTQSVVRSSRARNSEGGADSSVSQQDSIALSDELSPAALTASRIVGTYDYMSPEQRAGDEVDARSDIYSLAVVTVEMLTGERPYGDVGTRLKRHDVAQEFAAALLTALDEKEYRHPDAEAMMRAMRMDLPSESRAMIAGIEGQLGELLRRAEDAMVFVDQGVYTMGSKDGPENERPAHKEEVSPFFLSRYQVTATEFCFFLNDIGGNKGRLIRTGRACTLEQVGNIFRPVSSCENYPANCVSYTGAAMFCDWLTKRTGTTYRLPTEAEWEFVARRLNVSPETSCYGRQLTSVEETLCPVDAFTPSALGFYQLLGNVAEWCRDPYAGNYSHASVPNQHAPSGRLYVARGGSWSSPEDELIPTRRRVHIGQTFSPTIGFRIARSVGGKS